MDIRIESVKYSVNSPDAQNTIKAEWNANTGKLTLFPCYVGNKVRQLYSEQENFCFKGSSPELIAKIGQLLIDASKIEGLQVVKPMVKNEGNI